MRNTQVKIENKLYKTSDYLIATYLYFQGYNLVEINWVNSNRAEFFFGGTSNLEDDIAKFWKGEALVDAKNFLLLQREFKQRIYGSK